MFFEKNNGYSYSPNILISPLDWGLGHATRCIPIIYSLINNGATVFVAAEGAVALLLEKEFSQIKILPLPGYRVRYSRRESFFSLALFLQIPKLLFTVYNENRWLKKAIRSYKLDAVISDNRPGLWNKSIPCIYITHQLAIKTRSRFTDWLTQKIHYFFINKFNQCWVPDNENDSNLAGKLSHPSLMPLAPVKYIGPLSRFSKKETEIKYDLLISISGPEPQRTIFEKLLFTQIQGFIGKILFVRGLPVDNSITLQSDNAVEIVNHLCSDALSTAIQQSKLVICRSGYTSVMDLMALQKKAILVPTPGQTEQEYLADYLAEKKYFYSSSQARFSLETALKNAAVFPYNLKLEISKNYEAFVTGLLEKLRG